MELNISEIRTLLAICVRALHDQRDQSKNNVHCFDNIATRVEEAYDELEGFVEDDHG